MSTPDDTTSPGVTLRAIAAWLDSHPEVDASQVQLFTQPVAVHCFGIRDAAHLADTARALGGKWDKRPDDNSGLFTLAQEIAPGVVCELVADRSAVCERVTTGSVVVHEPDPAAVDALPKVPRTVETFEWRCAPLLSSAA